MKFGIDPLPEENTTVIDLTSLIDVLFVLLLFFMVTTTFSNSDGVTVNLPSASSKSSEAVQKDVTVSITEKGGIFFSDGSPAGGKAVTLDELSARLTELKNRGSDVTMVVRADKKVEHGAVVAVLDRGKSSGIEKIAIATVQASVP